MKDTLDKMRINEEKIVKAIEDGTTMKRRFLDIGLSEGTKVKCVLASFGDEMKAYEIKGAVIGIRKEDGQNVKIE